MLAPILVIALAASPLRPLPANAPVLPAGVQLRDASPSSPQTLNLGLKLRDRAALDRYILALHDPRAPQFRQWLTPAEFGDAFGTPVQQYDALVHALEKSGLEVKRYAGRTYLEAKGTASQVEKLLGVRLLDVESADGTYRTFEGTPHLPAALATLVQSVGGLDSRPHFKHRLQVRSSQTFGPQDLRRYYDMDALHALGYGGQLSKVAVVGTIPNSTNMPQPADINWFYANVSDSTATFIIDQLPLVLGQPDSQPGLRTELEMDAEMVTVGAPLVQSVTMVLAPPNSLFESGYSEVVNNLSDLTSVSTSFGGCELDEENLEPGELDTVAALVAQGVSEGIAFFSASGDDGVLTCSQSGTSNVNLPSVDFPSSSPYMTAVGGTMFTGSFDANGAIPGRGSEDETTWNEQNFIAGGGGVSNHFPRPPWQLVPGASDGGFREVPDVALLAATQPGVAIVDRSPGQIDPTGNGTSDASPMAAGIFAAVNDRIGGCRLGSPNFTLYALARAQYGNGGAAVFHDIVTGDISVQGTDGGLVQGPAAGVGYDEATGLGSLDVAALAEAWPPCAPPVVEVDAGPADAGDVDAGSADDAGNATDDGGSIDDGGSAIDAGSPVVDAGYFAVGPWDGGPGLDAGPRVAYDACAALACDGGTSCVTVTEGPSSCLAPCDLSTSTNPCPTGNYCAPFSGSDAGFCQVGCNADTDCTSPQVCNLCSHTCIAPGKADAGIGDSCTRRSDCQTGGFCLSESFSGLPGGYCSAQCSAGVSGACGCPTGSVCESNSGFCFETCTVSTQTGCRSGYVCDPSTQTGNADTGICLPNCNDLGGQCLGLDQTCDANTGLCAAPGQTSTSSSGSTSGSSGTSGIGSTSAGSTGTSSSGSTGPNTSGTTTAASSGSTGTTGGKGGGCGCSAGSGSAELSFTLLLALVGLGMRKKRA